MTPEERLAALLAEAQGLKTKAQGSDFTDEDSDRAVEIAKEVDALRSTIAKKKAASDALGRVGEVTQDSADEAPASTAAKGISLGERFIESEAFKGFKADNPSGPSKDTPFRFKAKELGNLRKRKVLDTSGAGNAAPQRIDDVDDLVFRPRRTLLDLVTRGTTDSPWFQYRQVISKTNNAAIVAEATANDGTGTAGGVKPLSTLTTQTADAKAATYADGMEVTNQELSDDGVIRSLIDSTLRENLEIVTEDMLLNGDSGTNADEPDGVLHTTGVLQQAFATDMPTSIRKAITLLRTTSGATIQGILINPEDNEAWDLLKDNEGRYLGNGPFGQGPGTAWGYERIESQAVEVGQAIIGDFSTIHLLDYEALAIDVFNQHKDYAQRNLAYIRAEFRAAQLIRNAAKLCVVELVSGV